MGNYWGTQVESHSPGTTGPPSPGTSSSTILDDVYPDGQILETPKVRVYTYAELRTATRNFRPDTILGEGGFGKVFKGWVDEKTYAPSKPGNGIAVAVKKLKPESMQGLQEWQSEVNFLGRLSHSNLVKLIGYCREDKELLLVYEFMQRGSLENHLFHRRSAVQPLSWSNRLKIALGAARGLAFLHTSQKQVIYRDFKASNILLDGNFNPKLSGFGLARNGPAGSDTHVTTCVMGTYGYAAPEYVATRHLYVKSDVYGFGVVLLEMLTGLRAIDTNRPSEQHNLVDWGKPLLSDRRKLMPIMDARLEQQYPVKAAVQAAQLTLKCLGQDPRNRPSMKEVVESLEQILTQKIRVYTYAELKSATMNFRPDTILGEGGFGRVFKGWVDEKTYAPSKPGNGIVVAVKKHNPKNFEGMQGLQEWQSEVNFLGRLSHPNLVKLIGYCREDKELLLVYEFMQRGSLENHLFHRRSAVQPLSWSNRLKIALGVARGLAFLHTSQKQVIYVDLKPSNILLDGNFNPKLSNFGLAKNGPAGGDTHVTTSHIMGTYKYLAPEYVANGHLYVKSNVYGFGVLLLEMLTGLRADTNRVGGQHNLVDWWKPLLSDQRKLMPIMDARLEEQYPVKVAVQAAQLTLKCLGPDPRNRPSMKEVKESLEQIQAIQEKPKESKSNMKRPTGGYRDGRSNAYQRSPLHANHGTPGRSYP